MSNHSKKLASLLWQSAIKSCDGESAVRPALEELPRELSYAILSIGKAANHMTLGAHQALGTTIPSLTISKDDHISEELKQLAREHKTIKYIEASHPIPDERSLLAGQLALDFIESLSEDTHLIMLLSGGASSVCELLPSSFGLEDLKKMTEEKLATGATIREINHARSQISLIKSGKILSDFKGQEVKIFLISDVKGEKVETIASGMGMYPHSLPIGKFSYSSETLRSNKDARKAVETLARQADIPIVENSESLYGDVYTCAKNLADTLKKGRQGIYIFGGEPTVVLPEKTGEGGRAQCLALALAGEITGSENITCLIAGTDGTDGPTASAGGLIDCQTFSPEKDARKALLEANSGEFLRTVDSLFVSGPTGTNVMDIAICLKLDEREAKQALSKIDQV